MKDLDITDGFLIMFRIIKTYVVFSEVGALWKEASIDMNECGGSLE